MRKHTPVPDLAASDDVEIVYICSSCREVNPTPDGECPAEGM